MRFSVFAFRRGGGCIPRSGNERNTGVHWQLFLASLVALAPLANAGEAKPSTAAMKEQLQTVILGQLEAFRKGDYPGAYRFAAPGIREQFPLEAFESMIKAGYPVIARNEEAVFGLTVDDGEKAVVNVRIVGRNKDSVSYQYLLERHGDAWQVGGVFELRANGKTI